MDDEVAFTITGTPVADVEFEDIEVTYGDIKDGNYSTTVPVGTYSVTEDEEAADVDGYTRTTTYSDPVTVEKGGNGTLTVTNAYEQDMATLKLTKTATGLEGTDVVPDTAKFVITGTPVADVEFEDVTVTYADIKDGKWSMEVPVGEYKVTESGAEVTGYSLETEYTDATVEKGGEGELKVTNTYTRTKIKITVTKVWDDDFENKDDYFGLRPDSVKFTVTGSDGETYDVELKGEGNTWTADLEVPEYTNGTKNTYTVDEEALVAGYTKEIEDLTITNTFEPIWGDPPVKKVVTGDTPAPTETFKFTLTAVKYEGEGKVDKLPMPEEANGAQSMTVEIEGEGEKEFGEFPLTVPGKYTYTITEEKGSAEGYTYSEEVYTIVYDVTVNEKTNALECVKTVTNKAGETKETAEEPADFVFENEYKKPLISVKVTKVWDDEDDAEGIRPETLNVKLLANGKDAGKVLVLSATTEWTGEFTDLDKYDADGKAITYTVEEEVPEGYVVAYSGDQESGFTITNTPDVPDTGDHSELFTWTSTMIASLLGIVLLAVLKRKKEGKHYSR